ncbi:Hypothetical predicted protein [Mytilus galloprovincialis]|uniref:AAA domain-containing protein n=1 Tax=Mytilus galloprovincialis TaxID=29158 RepID=A0A8B6DIC5_MYTGA|nr:Hypothetical predicted protein [Mytilus galloprovincialis]
MFCINCSRFVIVVWNNKGGAGKTTLTFHLSTEYAIRNPDVKVVIFDLCPQANISAALLSNKDEKDGGFRGDDMVKAIPEGEKVKCSDIDGNVKTYDRTVSGYLMAQHDITKIKHSEFLVQPGRKDNPNKFITENLFLLCGDQYLEVISRGLDSERIILRPQSTDGPWKKITSYLKVFRDELVKSDPTSNYVFFIDTNPSFSFYTELAITAGTRLIVPIMSDDFSLSSVKSMFYLLYGVEIDNKRDVRYRTWKTFEFWDRANTENIKVPKISLIINNKIIAYARRSATAVSAKQQEIQTYVNRVCKERPEIFDVPNDADPDEPMDTNETESNISILELNDFHSMAVTALHLGCPLSKLPKTIKMDAFNIPNPTQNRDSYWPRLFAIIKQIEKLTSDDDLNRVR